MARGSKEILGCTGGEISVNGANARTSLADSQLDIPEGAITLVWFTLWVTLAHQSLLQKPTRMWQRGGTCK
jgi:hypothetical protein